MGAHCEKYVYIKGEFFDRINDDLKTIQGAYGKIVKVERAQDDFYGAFARVFIGGKSEDAWHEVFCAGDLTKLAWGAPKDADKYAQQVANIKNEPAIIRQYSFSGGWGKPERVAVIEPKH